MECSQSQSWASAEPLARKPGTSWKSFFVLRSDAMRGVRNTTRGRARRNCDTREWWRARFVRAAGWKCAPSTRLGSPGPQSPTEPRSGTPIRGPLETLGARLCQLCPRFRAATRFTPSLSLSVVATPSPCTRRSSRPARIWPSRGARAAASHRTQDTS